MPPRRQLTPGQAQIRATVVELRRQRFTWSEIGTRLDITGQRAGQLYRSALAAIVVPCVDELRAEEGELIDMAVNRLLTIAEDDTVSPRTRVEAWTAIRGWSERRARLFGLDAPAGHQVLTLEVLDAEIAALSAELGL